MSEPCSVALIVTTSDKNVQLRMIRVDLEEVEDTGVGRRCRFEEAERGGRNRTRIACRGGVVVW